MYQDEWHGYKELTPRYTVAGFAIWAQHDNPS